MIFFVNPCISNPCWFEYLQTFSTVVAIILAFFTLLKLLKKDRKREAEIANLSVIADKLSGMQIAEERRYRNSKKPKISIRLEVLEGRMLQIKFFNTNMNSTLLDFEIKNDEEINERISINPSAINEEGGEQSFLIILESKEGPVNDTKLVLLYTTEEGYSFVQEVDIILKNGNYDYIPSAIIDEGICDS
ncbi:MAG: hypothetical protein GY834_15515 [Bacteroidetes bacterium]|nr:hypothetical protein [Bacteroidota bacterium]